MALGGPGHPRMFGKVLARFWGLKDGNIRLLA